MKTLYIITKATDGGAQRYVLDLSTHAPEGMNPIVAYGTPGRLVEELASHGIETHRIPSLERDIALISDFKSFLELIRCIRTIRPDVVHLNSSKAAGLGALAARLCLVRRVVFTAHGWPFKEQRGIIARTLIFLMSWFTALLSDVVIVVSKKDETIGKRIPFIAHKIAFIALGIDAPAFYSRHEAEEALHIGTKVRRIVTIAELTKNKGIAYAIEAIALLKGRGTPIEYFLIGDGEDRTTLETFARTRGVADRIHFLGFVRDASRYLSAFDLFLLPSLKEGAPYVLLEAASARIPCIATTAVDPNPELVRVPPGNAEALAQALTHDTHASSMQIDSAATMVTRTVALYR